MSFRGATFDYDRVAPRYDTHRTGGGPYLERLVALAREVSARDVLEIGPGTGNNTAAFLDAYPCQLTTVERSTGMICQARQKGIEATAIQGDGCQLPIASASVDFVFSVYVAHYFSDLAEAVGEMYRILRPGGAVAIVSAPHAFIGNHPMTAYFPSFAAIDLARFPADDVLEQAVCDGGFVSCGREVRRAAPKPIDAAYADRIRGRFISTYDLLPPDEFNAGLARLDADIARLGRLPDLLAWECLLVWGRKP